MLRVEVQPGKGTVWQSETTAGEAYHAALAELREQRVLQRVLERDLSLWAERDHAEVRQRQGWLTAPDGAAEVLAAANDLATLISELSLPRVVLCGMGGSSLGAAVLAAATNVKLEVLDTTHPAAVERALRDVENCMVIVSSKSGSTIETLSHFAAFEAAFRDANIDPTKRIVLISDPDSPLAQRAERQGYAHVLAQPDVGGRFSVFTAFGLVPATVAGADLGNIVRDAQRAVAQLAHEPLRDVVQQLAAFMVSQAPVLAIDCGATAGLFEWIEQLVAESTGKLGVGVLPVSAVQTSESHTAMLEGSLGSLFVVWMAATVCASAVLRVNPYDQPDVELAKANARGVLAEKKSAADELNTSSTSADVSRAIEQIRAHLSEGCASYVALLVFGDESSAELQSSVEMLARELSHLSDAPVTINWGPRYLHSTGQLFKGGVAACAYLQLVDSATASPEIPGEAYDFAQLFTAQARGEAQALRDAQKRVFTLSGRLEVVLQDALKSLSDTN